MIADPEKTARPTPRNRSPLLIGPGSVVADFYVGALLGQGAMGKVYGASSLVTGARVALKVVSVAGPSERARFQRSVDSRVETIHPSILPVLGHGVLDTMGYIATPRLVPSALDETINREEGHDFDSVANLMAPIGEALACLHESGWVHRDLKPANVLLSEEGHPVLVDYGLVKSHVLPALPEDTKPGFLCGTPRYMSSQRLAGEPAFPSDDAYAFALMLVELLTGRLPRGARGRSVLDLAESRSRGLEVPILRCPSVVRRLIQRGLSPQRENRPTLWDFVTLLS